MPIHSPSHSDESREGLRVVRALFEFGREVAGQLDPGSARGVIVRAALSVLRREWSLLYVPDEAREKLRIVASSRGAGFCAGAPVVEIGARSLAAEAFRSHLCRRLHGPDDPGAHHASVEYVRASSALFIPLLGPSECEGVLVVGDSSVSHEYTQLEVDAALAFGGHAALALENARLFDLSQAKAERWAALLDVCRMVSSSLDRDTILRRIVEHATGLTPSRGCTLFVLDEERGELRPIATNESSFVDEIMALRLKLGEGITGDVARTGKAEIVQHTLYDPRAKHVDNTPQDDECLCCVPLVSKERVLGVMALSRSADKPFTQDELELLTILAHHGSVAIENARLYDETRRALHDLEQTQQQLVRSEKLNAFGQLAGGVAHDFNNLLSAILGRAQLLLMNCEDPAIRAGLRVIEQTAQDGAQTVRRIQEFTCVRRDHNFSPVDLNEVVRGSLEMVAHSLHMRPPEATIELQTDLGALPSVDGSPSELREVLTNLVLNAVDAMPFGGRLDVSTRFEEGSLVLHVDDTGMGMSPEVLSHAFDPFYTTKKRNGTGLGLSIALGIMTRHRGSLQAESRPEGGSRFTLTLPPGTLQREVAAPPQAPDALGRSRILVVDDESPVREVLQDLLASSGHEVLQAGDGVQALALARQHPVDLVMTDLGMPGMNGWQVAEAIKREFPHVPVVLVTGWGGQVDVEEARSRSVDYVITKPFEVQEVMKVLADAVRLTQRAA